MEVTTERDELRSRRAEKLLRGVFLVEVKVRVSG